MFKPSTSVPQPEKLAKELEQLDKVISDTTKTRDQAAEQLYALQHRRGIVQALITNAKEYMSAETPPPVPL